MARKSLPALPFSLPQSPPRELTLLERSFVDAYLVHQGEPMAVVEQRAGVPAGRGHVMLADSAVRAVIDRELDARTARARLKADDVDALLADIVTLDVAQLVDEKNCLRPIADLPLNVRRAISSLDLVVFEGRVVGVKPVPTSKIKAIELLMKRLRMLASDEKSGSSATNTTYINIDYGDRKAQVEVGRPPIDVTPEPAADAAFRRAMGVG